MANTKISDMTAITSFLDAMEVPIVDLTLAEALQNKKFTIQLLKTLFMTSGTASSVGSGVWTTIYDSVVQGDVFLVIAYTDGSTADRFGAYVYNIDSVRQFSITSNNMSLQISGTDLQINQASGGAMDINWTYIKLL